MRKQSSSRQSQGTVKAKILIGALLTLGFIFLAFELMQIQFP